MYLKALEIQGFKSFPDKTRLTFEKNITAIVGPNGSGKSNISDAMLWVMGEQRSRALRGGKMEDVIFGGTEKRSPMGFAQVSLILDNSQKLFELDAPEVVITRRYYRSGDSEYYINRESVRLRDITELLMDTGLGRDGYSVIGQGRIAEIVSARSTDRREVFEEAAGIALYRSRKEDAERKLEKTGENLQRINDRIEELELQLSPLEKQAETAKRYLVLRDEQRLLEISVWMTSLDRLHEQAVSAAQDYQQASGELEKTRRELEAVYAQTEELTEEMRRGDVEAEALREKQSAADAEAGRHDAAAAVLETELNHNAGSISRLREEMGLQSGRAEDMRNQLARQDGRVSEIARTRQETEGEIRRLLDLSRENSAQTEQARQELEGLLSRENGTAALLAENRARSSMLAERRAELDQRRQTIDGDLSAGEARLREAEEKLNTVMGSLAGARERVLEQDNSLTGFRMLLSRREERFRELSEEAQRLTVERRTTESRVNMLTEMQREYEGMGKAVRSVMRQAGRGALWGVHGPVGGLISVEDRYTLAIETALGAAMQNIVVDSQDAGKSAIEYLKRTGQGRCTFLPLDVIRPNAPRRMPAAEEGLLGLAADFVRCRDQYRDIILNLLGRTFIAESLSDAIRISRNNANQLRIVTLDGQLLNAGGAMTGGSSGKGTGILSRANELKALGERLEGLIAAEEDNAAARDTASRDLEAVKFQQQTARDSLEAAENEVRRLESDLMQQKLLFEAASEALDNLKSEKNSLEEKAGEISRTAEAAEAERSGLEKRLEDLRAERLALSGGQEESQRKQAELDGRLSELRQAKASLDAEREALEKNRRSLEELLSAMTGDEASRRDAIAAMEEKNLSLEKSLQEEKAAAEEMRRKAGEVKSRLAGISQSRLALEGRRTVSEKKGQEINRQLLDMQSVCAKFEQKKASAELEENQIIDKLWDSYELSRSAAQTLRQPVENMAKAQKRVSELRREIAKLGPVNVPAIEEYQRVKERYAFFAEQRDDVTKSKRELEGIIAGLTREMKEQFAQRFKAIDLAFREVFFELFGGGKAALELEDEENILECGIEIRVQPPGKAVTTISLLSGGEKSFVAIALYFAIMKVRPTPFCIMDEIDAALDEANVFRFADYMRSMSEKTQFIAITHHRGTMEGADMLYGVTMQEKGVTTVLSLDLEEAERAAS